MTFYDGCGTMLVVVTRAKDEAHEQVLPSSYPHPYRLPTRPSNNQSRTHTHHECSHVTIFPEKQGVRHRKRHLHEIPYAPVAPSADYPRAQIQTLFESPGTSTHLS
ncbi:hypothetical protein SNOG_02014 [Parastagonospora nodorum SN15]|uniref:Uncharacterized protein n=1 Tax=Phaeosphaeria nodorum (strain SN15 / ATCC MYA-4574 / FGSC 10173) TaxID=321614 RepID=Q0V1V0_PHANO|nr:hypothetical protein SNOG_02014 [Parastagonospora nodorum SN15]EAT90226.1 hypothetical protein SNOG_02014 [Parastagonospora nodorum SN15]